MNDLAIQKMNTGISQIKNLNFSELAIFRGLAETLITEEQYNRGNWKLFLNTLEKFLKETSYYDIIILFTTAALIETTKNKDTELQIHAISLRIIAYTCQKNFENIVRDSTYACDILQNTNLTTITKIEPQDLHKKIEDLTEEIEGYKEIKKIQGSSIETAIIKLKQFGDELDYKDNIITQLEKENADLKKQLEEFKIKQMEERDYFQAKLSKPELTNSMLSEKSKSLEKILETPCMQHKQNPQQTETNEDKGIFTVTKIGEFDFFATQEKVRKSRKKQKTHSDFLTKTSNPGNNSYSSQTTPK